jgi:hypothetical protein
MSQEFRSSGVQEFRSSGVQESGAACDFLKSLRSAGTPRNLLAKYTLLIRTSVTLYSATPELLQLLQLLNS